MVLDVDDEDDKQIIILNGGESDVCWTGVAQINL